MSTQIPKLKTCSVILNAAREGMRRPNAATLFDDGDHVNLTFSTRGGKVDRSLAEARRAKGKRR